MTNPTIDLDQHRGMAAQKATELRRLMTTVAADAKALRERQDELEGQLAATPAETWLDAAGEGPLSAGSLRNHACGTRSSPANLDCQRAR